MRAAVRSSPDASVKLRCARCRHLPAPEPRGQLAQATLRAAFGAKPYYGYAHMHQFPCLIQCFLVVFAIS